MAASDREYGAFVTQRICGLWQQGTVAASVRKLFISDLAGNFMVTLSMYRYVKDRLNLSYMFKTDTMYCPYDTHLFQACSCFNNESKCLFLN